MGDTLEFNDIHQEVKGSWVGDNFFTEECWRNEVFKATLKLTKPEMSPGGRSLTFHLLCMLCLENPTVANPWL